MTDAISVLEQSNKKLAAKVEKLRNQLALAETELSEGQTAVRVLKKLGLSPTVDGVSDDGKPSSQEQVRNALPTNESEALTPREVHQAVDGTISPDNVRTILLRLKTATGTDVRVTGGRYWREIEQKEGPAEADSDFDDIDALIGGSRPQPAAFESDPDSDVPF